MDVSVIIGSLGVSILLAAFLLNLFSVLSQQSWLYAVMNIIGAGLSCYASVLIQYIPFIILEGIWCIVACIGLIKLLIVSAPHE